MLDRVVGTDEGHVLLTRDSLVTTQIGVFPAASVTLSNVYLGMRDAAVIACDGDQMGHSRAVQRFH